MGLLFGIVVALIHLVFVALDVTLIFFIAHIASRRWRGRIIDGLGRAGEVLVDAVSDGVNRGWLRLFPGRSLSPDYQIKLTLGLLVLARSLATSLFLLAR